MLSCHVGNDFELWVEDWIEQVSPVVGNFPTQSVAHCKGTCFYVKIWEIPSEPLWNQEDNPLTHPKLR